MAEYVVEEPSDRSASWRVHERIVRCRDCEYFEQGYTDGVMFDETVCWAWDNGHDYPNFTNPDGFCYRGKRKERK